MCKHHTMEPAKIYQSITTVEDILIQKLRTEILQKKSKIDYNTQLIQKSQI